MLCLLFLRQGHASLKPTLFLSVGSKGMCQFDDFGIRHELFLLSLTASVPA